jgi:hypothetical protein
MLTKPLLGSPSRIGGAVCPESIDDLSPTATNPFQVAKNWPLSDLSGRRERPRIHRLERRRCRQRRLPQVRRRQARPADLLDSNVDTESVIHQRRPVGIAPGPALACFVILGIAILPPPAQVCINVGQGGIRHHRLGQVPQSMV